MRVVKDIRCYPQRIPPNLRYIDRKKVRAATVKINKIGKLKQVLKQTQNYAGNIIVKMVGYKNKEMTANRTLEKQKALRKE